MDRDEIKARLAGPIPSLPTTFHRDGSIDDDGIRSVADLTIDAGANAVMLTYGDSLYSLLTDEEVGHVTRLVADHTAGRAVVIAADRGWWLGKELEFADEAREAGADVLMALPPDWGASCTPRTLADYYAAVSQRIPVMVVTNVFAPRGHDFGLETLQIVLDEAGNVVAAKDDVCGPFARKLGLLAGDRWALISGGQKQNHLDMLPYGCHAYLSTFIKFAPSVTKEYWGAIEAGDMARAVAVIERYDIPFFDYTLKLAGGFDAGVHGALELFGLAQRWRRPPYYSLTDEEMEGLAGLFGGMGLL